MEIRTATHVPVSVCVEGVYRRYSRVGIGMQVDVKGYVIINVEPDLTREPVTWFDISRKLTTKVPLPDVDEI